MEFFLHSTTARYSSLLKNLEAEYGLAGIGFYWKAVELIMSSCRKVPIDQFQILRYKQIGFYDAYKIIYSFGLFEIDENFYVSLARNADNGIDKKSINSYSQHLQNSVLSRAGDGAITPTGDSAIAPTCNSECACPGPIKLDRDKIRRERENAAHEQFNRFMKIRCPHLREMEDPLTLEDFRELKKDYSWQQIQDVLVSMENETNLPRYKRSCYQTALTWLKKRHGVPSGGLRQKGIIKVHEICENGKTIYFPLAKTNNEQQDSNSTDGPATVEQQGDGSRCTEQPDE